MLFWIVFCICLLCIIFMNATDGIAEAGQFIALGLALIAVAIYAAATHLTVIRTMPAAPAPRTVPQTTMMAGRLGVPVWNSDNESSNCAMLLKPINIKRRGDTYDV